MYGLLVLQPPGLAACPEALHDSISVVLVGTSYPHALPPYCANALFNVRRCPSTASCCARTSSHTGAIHPTMLCAPPPLIAWPMKCQGPLSWQQRGSDIAAMPVQVRFTFTALSSGALAQTGARNILFVHHSQSAFSWCIASACYHFGHACCGSLPRLYYWAECVPNM